VHELKDIWQDKISRADVSTHGATFVPIVAGSDKTTVSVATGHQEYHPVYQSPGVLTGVARRAHGNGVLPVAFLPIPKSKLELLSQWVIPHNYRFSDKETPKVTHVSALRTPAVPCMPNPGLRASQAGNDNTRGHQMP
jgi:hypothetical protein